MRGSSLHAKLLRFFHSSAQQDCYGAGQAHATSGCASHHPQIYWPFWINPKRTINKKWKGKKISNLQQSQQETVTPIGDLSWLVGLSRGFNFGNSLRRWGGRLVLLLFSEGTFTPVGRTVTSTKAVKWQLCHGLTMKEMSRSWFKCWCPTGRTHL